MSAGTVRHPKKIAVIGGTGFIGRRVTGLLRDRGDVVRVIVRPGSVRRALIPEGVEVCEAQLASSDPRLASSMRGVDAIVYAAGTVRGRDLADFLPGNVEGVAAVAGAAPECRLIALSSLAAGEPQLSHYARSKRMGECVLEERSTATGPVWTILRPTAVYGPGDRELRPVFALVRRGILPCLAGPLQRLSFIHVDDVADAVMAAIDNPDAVARRTYSLDDGTPRGYGRAELAAALRPRGRTLTVRVPRPALALAAGINLQLSRWLRRSPMLTPGKVAELTHGAWLADNRAFTAATGWKPRFDLATGSRTLFEGT